MSTELTTPIKIEIPGIGTIESADLYLKSEVDKVIEELKAQKTQAEDDCAYWKTMAQKNAADNVVMAKQRAEAFKRECYHKYKRCLAMADYCFARSVAEDVLHTNRDGIEHADYWICRHKMWLELAEKFKEAK